MMNENEALLLEVALIKNELLQVRKQKTELEEKIKKMKESIQKDIKKLEGAGL